jgi:murein DD-endopeptidase MepM/ murein hydrolase activator NlpD
LGLKIINSGRKISDRLLFVFLASILILLGLVLPVQSQDNNSKTFIGPTRGAISSLFGWRADPITGKSGFHCGLDIAAKLDTPVYALQDGYIIYSGAYGGYGKAVIVKHEYPDMPEIPVIETMYAHNDQILARVGERVKRGDVIALVGSTGRSTGPHVHFEVHYNGGYVNPIDYLVKLPRYLNYIAYKRSKYYAYKSMPVPTIRPHITAQEKRNYVMIED